MFTMEGWCSLSWVPSSCWRKCQGRRRHPSGLRVAAKNTVKVVSKGLQKHPTKDLSRILWTEAAIKGVDKKSGSQKHNNNNLWPKAVLEALDEAIQLNRWDAALKVFGLLRKQHWYEPRCQTYTKLLMMLAKSRKPHHATSLFHLLLSDRLRPTLDVFTALLYAYALSGLFQLAFATLHDMMSVYDCHPDVHTFSILLNCCVKSRRFHLLHHILAHMSSLGIQPTTVTFNTILDGYGKAELFENMERFFSEMIETATCHPDVFTFNSFIWAYGNSGQIHKMESWYQEFQLMGISPDVRTFNILIRSYGKAGMYQKMESILHYMETRFFSPTVVTFNTVIDVLGRAGNFEKMEDFFLKMKHQGMKPNTVTYCSLVNAYSRAGKLHKVDSILRQVENSNVALDTPFYNCLISAYGRSGNVDRMEELFLEMKEKHCEPDHITFASMTQAYDAKGMTEASEDTKSKMLALQSCSGPKLLR